jgi:hypothetical protein
MNSPTTNPPQKKRGDGPGLVPVPDKNRICLCCNEPFASYGPHNRICPVCKDRNASLSRIECNSYTVPQKLSYSRILTEDTN